MNIQTHPKLDRSLCGTPTAVDEGRATVDLITGREMVADAEGLVHGGFVFGAADYAAMLAVNHPNVVLGSANVRFTAPVRVGETVTCTAAVESTNGRKHEVGVTCTVGERVVLTGTLTCFVLDHHVLSGSPS
jgi:acyl-coenzyme A thioesterase PaaI-like protein